MPLVHRMVETNGVRLHCAIDGDGPLVILLHGFPECWYSWRHQLAALAPVCRVVAPDLRGYNESERPQSVDAYRTDVLVEDVLGLVRAFGEEEATIVGHDWGGAIAWLFATRHPEATRRLAVLNCPHPAIMAEHLRRNPRQLLRSWYMFFFQIPWLPETLLGLNRAWAIADGIRRSAVQAHRLTDDDLEYLRDAASRPGALKAAINYYRAMFRSPEALATLPPWLRRFLYGDSAPVRAMPSTVDEWPRIQCPTLLIWGERDVALGRELIAGTERLVAAPFTLRLVPDAGHWVQQEQPEVVNATLLEFLGTAAFTEPRAAGPS